MRMFSRAKTRSAQELSVYAMSPKPSFYLISLLLSSCLVFLSVIICSRPPHFAFYPTPSWTPTTASKDSFTMEPDLSLYSTTFLQPALDIKALVSSQATTVILPVVAESLDAFPDLLFPFLGPQLSLLEIVIICPTALLSSIRSQLHEALLPLGPSIDHLDIILRSSPQGSPDLFLTVLDAISESIAELALIIDDSGLAEGSRFVEKSSGSRFQDQDPLVGSTLLDTLADNDARYLHNAFHPPFAVPVGLVRSFKEYCEMSGPALWKDFVLYVEINQPSPVHQERLLSKNLELTSALSRTVPFPDHDALSNATSDLLQLATSSFPSAPPLYDNDGEGESSFHKHQFLVFLPARRHLNSLFEVICSLQVPSKSIHPRILVYDGEENSQDPTSLEKEGCIIEYESKTLNSVVQYVISMAGDNRISGFRAFVDVVICLDVKDLLVDILTGRFGSELFPEATFIKIPEHDLDQTQWMSALSLRSWKNWQTAQIDITVITKDRPQSLKRLMDSLLLARYFGDPVTLRINVEQDCDDETLKIIENIDWPFGSVFIHRRVVHGGLLPAVVESWYPQGNNSYGVLLEDDVELSPLFYAWIKMTVLHYRYNGSGAKANKLFGISLYQQKHLELPLSGRHEFNPRLLFSEAGFPNADTPYLSQVPCSWGAVYFPEHWREFHDYLSLRLTETAMTLDEEVVPGVRSNFWSKSWKRFYIELVYLRGYAMLYPNYEDFLSLSTNHLEVGSHVKVRSQEKRDLFLLPLLPLSPGTRGHRLLEIPDQRLPAFETLPVLDLTGTLTSLEEISAQGDLRRSSLLNCTDPTDMYNIRTLLCLRDATIEVKR
ncbi:hypothetical protein D9613_006824 [Agrocybe pediades]|uniref:Uncharacterized protein n=1 Tax=Agrocybe pediades TaxID=84607 RepID=A0A8H4QIL7_9AGAR|nr:hypothetical protein D9613_006824 [Agrocybe pediades]